jgi:adenylate cyclase
MSEESRTARRLAAILAADVAGYSRLMGADEEGTLAALKAHRRELIDPLIAQHQGRIVKTTGDGVLMEFASIVDAVRCAVVMQQGMEDRNANVSESERIRFRVGINVGDVIVEDDDIFGDGVNLAARLEGLAAPGGICISGKVHDEVAGKLDLDFEDLGEQPVKNMTRPVRVYRVVIGAEDAADGRRASVPVASPPAPDVPSIVVLALQNMSADPEQEYFADGIAEDIITDLSKVSGLVVIARNSAFAYKGRAANLRQVCRELRVRYALEGSVRKAGRRVRITTQLIDGASGGHVWAERYDRDLTDIFEVQDEVTREIVAALKVKLTPEERGRLAGRGTTNIEAYDWYLRGRELVWRHTRDEVAEGRPLLERAIALDPGFAAAYAHLSMGHIQEYINRWSADPERSLALARELAERAVQLDEGEPQAQRSLAVVHIWQKQVDESIAVARRAITLDPNSADAYGTLGNALHYAGRPAESLENYERMARLNPHFPPIFFFFMAQDHFALERYEKAAELLERRLARQSQSDISRVLLAACYGHLERPEDARKQWQEALRINPEYSIEHRRRILPYKNPEDFERVVLGLRKAGLPV